MREAEIAWAAGLFEGEGCFAYQGPSATRKSGANVRAELAMTDFEPVERFHAVVGVGRLVSKPKRNPNHNDQLLWRVTDRAGVQHVLDLLGPWLSERRQQKGAEILRLQAEAMQKTPQPRRNGGPFISRTATYENALGRCVVCGRECVWRGPDGRVAHPGCSSAPQIVPHVGV